MSALSPVAICNQALGWLGVKAITSFEDESTQAGLCKRVYQPSRDALLQAYEWSFAIFRLRLTPQVATDEFPENPDGNYFALPDTVLQVLAVSFDGAFRHQINPPPYEVEGRSVICRADAIFVRYLKRIEDTTRFTSGFTESLAARIGSDLAMPLTHSKSLYSTMLDMYTGKLRDAVSVDGMQGTSKRLRATSLHNARKL